MGGVQRILVATDLSEISNSLFTIGWNLARASRAELIAAHIADRTEYEEITREIRMGIDEYLGRLRSTILYAIEQAIDKEIPVHLEVVMPERSVPEEILAMADRVGADLIVMGTHGRTGLRRVLLGSVAEAVLRHATVPVLVVPTATRDTRERIPVSTVVSAPPGG